MHALKPDNCECINRAMNINRLKWVTHTWYGKPVFFLKFLSSSRWPSLNIFNKLRPFSNVILFESLFEAKSLLLSKWWWCSDELFVPRFTASIFSHSRTSEIYGAILNGRCTLRLKTALVASHCTLCQLFYSNIDVFMQFLNNFNSRETSLALDWFFNQAVPSVIIVLFSPE